MRNAEFIFKTLLIIFLLVSKQSVFNAQTIEIINPIFNPSGDYYLTLGTFTDTLNGWVAEPNTHKMFFTTNGGKNWQIQKEFGNEKISDIYFYNYNNGWVVTVLPDKDSSKIYFTGDGGKNWSSYEAPLIYSVNFFHEEMGIGVGKAGMYKTTDGGKTWRKKNFDYEGELSGLKIFLKDNFGYAVGTGFKNGYHTIKIKTTDYGENWEFLPYIPGDFPTNLWFFSEEKGIIVAWFNIVISVSESGKSWESKSNNISGFWNDIAFFDDSYGFIVGEAGDIAVTKNGGDTWNELETDSIGYLSKIILLNDYETGFAFGPYNTLIKIKKEITTGINTDKIIPVKFELQQNFPNPFNPSTTINYSLPVTSDVEINIYDLTGRLIKTFTFNSQQQGKHKIIWDGKNWHGVNVSSGIYIYRIKAVTLGAKYKRFIQSRKMVLLK